MYRGSQISVMHVDISSMYRASRAGLLLQKKTITRRLVDREVQYGALAFVCLPVEPTALYLLAQSRGILHGVCHSS